MLRLKIITFVLLLCTFYSFAQTETYYLLTASRDGKNEQLVQIGENRGTKLFLMASCKRCMPATYTHNKEASSILGKPVYGKSGIYVLPYDENSYAIVLPNTVLGEGIWNSFTYTNFISKDKTKVSRMTKKKVENWAIDLSKKIMNGEINTTPVNTGSNVYYPGAKIGFGGKRKESKVKIDYTKEKLLIGSLLGNGNEDYYYLPKMSKALGVEIYQDNGNLREYAIIESPLSVIWLKFSSGSDLGRSEWEKYDKVNYFHKNQQVVRKLLTDEVGVNKLMDKIKNWCTNAIEFKKNEYKAKEENDIKNRRLPKRGLKNLTLEAQALVAAKNWAKKYRWKETITRTYFTSNDWSIYRHSVTGRQLGRRINGVIVMKRPDGKCSFHHAVFNQEYNGSGYQKVFTEGITPGKNILKCEYTR